MANIAFPNVGLESVTLSLDWPSQRIHTSIYTGSQQAISRGVGRWRGTMVFAARSRSQQSREIAAIESFFALAEGAVNTFDLPVPQVGGGVSYLETAREFPAATLASMVNVRVVGNTLVADLVAAMRAVDNLVLSPALPSLGDFVSAGGYLFRVVVDGSSGAGTDTGDRSSIGRAGISISRDYVLSPRRPLELPSWSWVRGRGINSAENYVYHLLEGRGIPMNYWQPTVRARFTQSQPSSPRYDVDWAGPWAASWESVD